MTLQECPGGSGFCDFESVNARKTFVCALYRHEKRLQKMPPGSQGAGPGAASVWRLESRSCVELGFFCVFGGFKFLCLDMFDLVSL